MSTRTFADTVHDGVASGAALDRIANLAARVADAPTALVGIIGEERYCAVGAGGASTADIEREWPLENSLCTPVIADRLQVVVVDTAADPRYREHPTAAQFGIRAYVGTPLHDSDGQVVGSLCILDTTPRDWSEDQLASLRDLAECASTQLALSALAREREQARVELESSNAFQNAVLESLTEGVVACDAGGRLAYFNKALRAIHGIPERALDTADWAPTYQLYGSDAATMLEPEEIPLARAFAGERVDQQHMVVRCEGAEPRHFAANGGPVLGADGSLLGAAVAMRDITDQVRRQRLRRAELAVATALADGAADIETVYGVLATLREALGLSSCEYVEIGGRRRSALPQSVQTATATVDTVHMPSPDHPGQYEVAYPIVVGDDVGAVLHLIGPSAELLDDHASSMITAVAALLGRWREQQRASALRGELAAARAVLEHVVTQINDLVFSSELLPDGGAHMTFQGSAEGIVGGPISGGLDWRAFFDERIPEEDRAELDRWRTDVRSGRASSMTCRLRGFDDRVRWIWTRSAPRFENGRHFVDGICTDVTERQQVALEREELLRRRKEQVSELQAVDRVKDEFVATVGHEIRGPLGLLVTFADDLAERLAASPADESAQRSAALVRDNADHLSRVVENIFDLARLDARPAVRHAPVALAAALKGLADQYGPIATSAGVTIEVDVDPSLAIEADASLLRQAVENLVANAVKFSVGGGCVRIDGFSSGEEVVVRVRDEGIGIPDEDLPYLFTRFYRASNALTASTPGTGLGLAVTQRIVAAHDGRIVVHSATGGPDRGTAFELHLPARPTR